jgi:hypothetical protein
MKMKMTLTLTMFVAVLGAVGCKSEVPPEVIKAYEARAEGMCGCMKMGDAAAAKACVKEHDAIEAPATPAKHDVTPESWAPIDGFRDAYTKCRMGANSKK